MSTTTVERPQVAGPDSGLGGNWLVIVRNDNHNTFEHVARTLAAVVPGISLSKGQALADQIHNSGQAMVWSAGRALLGAAEGRRVDHGPPGAALASRGARRVYSATNRVCQEGSSGLS